MVAVELCRVRGEAGRGSLQDWVLSLQVSTGAPFFEFRIEEQLGKSANVLRLQPVAFSESIACAKRDGLIRS